MRRFCGFLVALACTASVFPGATKAVAGDVQQPIVPQTNSCVDLRPAFKNFGLEQRLQGSRPTCSVFTVAGAVEFAIAKREGKVPRLSVEFLNWASNQAVGDVSDGGFFSDLWKGFERYGICKEAEQPYESKFDPSRIPTQAALEDAKSRLAAGLRLHWIKEWNVNTGLTDDQLAAIKRTLQRGWPVCGGFRWPKQQRWIENVLQMCPPDAVYDGHSVLIVGYRTVESQPGGGDFIFRNTSTGHDGEMPFAYAREYMNDAAWVDFQSPERAMGSQAAKAQESAGKAAAAGQ